MEFVAECDVLSDAREGSVLPAQVLHRDGHMVLVPPDPSAAPLLIVMTAAGGWTMPVRGLFLRRAGGVIDGTRSALLSPPSVLSTLTLCRSTVKPPRTCPSFCPRRQPPPTPYIYCHLIRRRDTILCVEIVHHHIRMHWATFAAQITTSLCMPPLSQPPA